MVRVFGRGAVISSAFTTVSMVFPSIAFFVLRFEFSSSVIVFLTSQPCLKKTVERWNITPTWIGRYERHVMQEIEVVDKDS